MTKRVLDTLSKLAKKQPEDYQTFWNEFGTVLKEGPAEDFGNREKIAGLLRFATTHTGEATQDVSLDDYIGRMKEGQNKIYYITADNFMAAKSSPHLEVFRKKGVEVLILTDRIDEWMMGYLTEYDGKSLQDVARGDLDLGDVETEEDKKHKEEAAEEHKELLERIKKALDDRIQEVRVTNRLTDSPACLVVGDFDMGAQMKKIMEAAGQKVPDSKPIFEINVDHPLVQRLEKEQGEERFGELSAVLLDQATLASGEQLPDPGAYVTRLNRLLLEMAN
jgi:molecular chaperone HtpG